MGVKKYEMPDGKIAVFEYDAYGIGKITVEAMDMLMGLINTDSVNRSKMEKARIDQYGYIPKGE